jgi:hypothetical protein
MGQMVSKVSGPEGWRFHFALNLGRHIVSLFSLPVFQSGYVSRLER